MSDINLNGYVQKRRGVLQHLHDGRITLNEYIIFDILLMLADKSTGSGKINATAIEFWTAGQLGKDGADRALRTLEEKDYIVREIVPGRRAVYIFHIQKFIVTYGAEQGKVLTFKKNPTGIDKTEELLQAFHAEPADEGAVHPADVPAEERAEEPPALGADYTRRENREEIPDTGVDLVDVVIKAPTKERKSKTPAPPRLAQPHKPQQAPVSTKPIPDPKEILGDGPDANKLTNHWRTVTRHWEYKKTDSQEKSNTSFEKLLAENTEAQILQVMDYAIQSPVWFRGATTVNYQQPWEWIVAKFDQIKAAMDGDKLYTDKLEQEAQKEAAAKMRGKTQAVADAKAEKEAVTTDPLFKVNSSGAREITRKPRTTGERRQLLDDRAKPRTNRQYFNSFLAQDGCPECHGTGLECDCIEKEELV